METPPTTPFVPRWAAFLRALRPKQWTKNALLFAGLLFTLNLPHSPQDYLRALAGFAVFCLLSGCAYLLNDIQDVEADRQHPTKRLRPIASGALPVGAARTFVFVMAPLALVTAFALGLGFFVTALGYFVVTLAYSFRLKHIALLDVMGLAAGFVLRALAGAVVIGVEPSVWLLLCTGLLALFLALTKRRSELAALGDRSPTRAILSEYSLPLLDQLITIVAAVCIMAYSLYTFNSPAGKNRPYLMATIPFVLYGLFRYLFLSHRKGLGEAPEVVLLEDVPLRVNVLLWTLVVVLVMLLGK